MDSKRGFTSRLGFILSMAAFSIGIGNLWKFPYVVGNSGGGAFLLVYILMVLFVGIPVFLIELTLGRSSQLSPIAGMKKLTGKKKTGWTAIGWLGVVSIFLIVGYATMIVGAWTLGYLYKILTGELKGLDAAGMAEMFGKYSGSWGSIVFSLLCSILLLLCLNSGVKKGVERVCSILLPLLFIIMIALAIYANTLPGALDGLKWYLTPDFSKINASVISTAATQVFFSIGIGMLCAFVYGSYITKDTNLTQSVVITGVLDTCIAILAGLICTPALFAFNIEPTVGPSLIFVTLPQLFNAMGSFGNIFGAVFMLCVFFAGFTSVLGGEEALVATIADSTGMDRKKISMIVVGIVFVLSIFFTMSFGDTPLADFKILGLGFFDFADFIASGICLTLGSIVMLAFVLFKWGFKKFKDEANAGAVGKIKVYDWMRPYFCYALPVILIVVCYCIVRMYI